MLKRDPGVPGSFSIGFADAGADIYAALGLVLFFAIAQRCWRSPWQRPGTLATDSHVARGQHPEIAGELKGGEISQGK